MALSVFSVAHAENATDATDATDAEYEKGDQAYEKGNCEEALERYSQVLSDPELPKDDQDFVRFRMAYCQLEVNQLTMAQQGFIAVIRSDPKNDEARLKLGEVLIARGNPGFAKKSLASVKDPNFKFDARILMAQIELQDLKPDEAVAILEKTYPTTDQRSVYYYWLGVAQFNYRDWAHARESFEKSIKLAAKDEWTKPYAEDWLKNIDQETRALSGSFTLGYIFDGNVGQSSTQPVSGGSPVSVPLPDEATYIKDHAIWTSAEIDWLLSHTGRWRFGFSFDFSSAFYRHNVSYDNQNLSAEFSALYVRNPKSTYSLNFKYLDSRYDWKYYQDYVSVSPKFQYVLGPKINLQTEVGYTSAIRTGTSKLLTGSGTIKYVLLPNLSLLGGANIALGSAKKATFSSSTSIDTGSLGGNYKTYGAFGGASVGLPFEIWATLLGSYFFTKYEEEDRAYISDPARIDHLKTYSLDVSKSITEFWSLNLTYTQTFNRSAGLQSLPSSTTMSNYNYDRKYVLLAQTLRF